MEKAASVKLASTASKSNGRMLSRIGKYTYQKYPILEKLNSLGSKNIKKNFVNSKLA